MFIDNTLMKRHLKYIKKSIKGSRFTSVTHYLEDTKEQIDTRMAALEQPDCEGSLRERQKEHKSLSLLSRSYLSLLMLHIQIQYRSGKNV